METRCITLSSAGARKAVKNSTAYQAQAQRTADATGNVVRFLAPNGVVLAEATPSNG